MGLRPVVWRGKTWRFPYGNSHWNHGPMGEISWDEVLRKKKMLIMMGYMGHMGYMGWGFHEVPWFIFGFCCVRNMFSILGYDFWGQYQALVSQSVSYSTFEVDQHFKTCGMTILGLMVVLWYPFCTHKLTSWPFYLALGLKLELTVQVFGRAFMASSLKYREDHEKS